LKLTKEVKTAILVILGIVFLIFGINYLKGKNLLESTNTFYTQFDYNGLTNSSPVTIKGNQIGRIRSIAYDYESGKTKVAFTIDQELKFSKNSKIRMYELGLMGGNGIAIIPANDSDFAASGAFLESEVELGLVQNLTNNFSGIGSNLDATLKSADTLLINLNKIVEDESENGLKSAITELNSTLKSFKNVANSFNSLVSKNDESLTSVIDNFNKVSEDLASLSNDLKDAEIAKTVNDLDQTLLNVNALLAGLEKGEGSLGKLLNDDKLYNNLEVASAQLKELLQDFKLNPKRYINVSVFGGKNKKEFVKPEDERE
jgi:phospholipid/cholesterol/gamma-HCH transport system substrate-binding protein